MMITDDVSINCSLAKPSFSVFYSYVFLLVIHVSAIINASSNHRCVFPLFKKGLHIACHNIDRLITAYHTDKLDEIRILPQNVQYNLLDGLCETFINKTISDSFIGIDGFQLERKKPLL